MIKNLATIFLSLFLSTLAVTGAWADISGDQKAILRSLRFQSGLITIANGMATLSLSPKYRYLDATDAKTFLTKIAGNAPSAVEGIDGLFLPTQANERWFAVLAYAAEGHVLDSDAASVNYDDLLKDMQKKADEQAQQQRSAGYAGLRILGWAQKPYYDSTNKKLYWAKSIQFDNQPNVTLNYDVRILGRTGYVNIKIVDTIDDLQTINADMPEILKMINFNPGNRYADYVAGTDRTAAYGIAGLIAGGVLAKAGFFKGLLVLAAAFWKALAAAAVAGFAVVGNFFRNLFRRKPAE